MIQSSFIHFHADPAPAAHSTIGPPRASILVDVAGLSQLKYTPAVRGHRSLRRPWHTLAIKD